MVRFITPGPQGIFMTETMHYVFVVCVLQISAVRLTLMIVLWAVGLADYNYCHSEHWHRWWQWRPLYSFLSSHLSLVSSLYTGGRLKILLTNRDNSLPWSDHHPHHRLQFTSQQGRQHWTSDCFNCKEGLWFINSECFSTIHGTY